MPKERIIFIFRYTFILIRSKNMPKRKTFLLFRHTPHCYASLNHHKVYLRRAFSFVLGIKSENATFDNTKRTVLKTSPSNLFQVLTIFSVGVSIRFFFSGRRLHPFSPGSASFRQLVCLLLLLRPTPSFLFVRIYIFLSICLRFLTIKAVKSVL